MGNLAEMLEVAVLSPEHQRKWSETRAALVWHAPAFTHIFYSMMNNTGNGELLALFITDESAKKIGIPVAATDGNNILIVPSTFFAYSLAERIFVVAHEILHAVFDHNGLMQRCKTTGKVPFADGSTLPYDQDTMNKAMDYVINDMLIDSKVGQFNSDWLHDPSLGTKDDSVLEVYRKVYEDQQGGGGGGGKGQGSGKGKSFDAHLPPGTSQGKSPSQAMSDRNPMDWKTEVARAIASAKAQGKLPAGLERIFSDYLEPTVDWTDLIHGFFARKVGSGSWNWRQPDRRFVTRGIIAPSRQGHGCGTIVCAIDTSGSIGQKELDLFFGNLAGILEDVRPNRIVVMYCDAKVHSTHDVEDITDLNDLRMKRAPGGGGTSFVPVFDEITEQNLEPDALVYLTDGMGRFPSKPPAFPVLWGAIEKGVKYPFGEVVDVPPVR